MKILATIYLFLLTGFLQVAMAGLDTCGTVPGGPACTVPEPGVYLLILSGVIGLGIVKYLKRKK